MKKILRNTSKAFLVLLLIFSLFAPNIILRTPVAHAAGTTYYVDQTGGSDSADGLTTGTAWKTISKVNGSVFSADDQILFKRGEMWREQLSVPSGGTSGHPIVFGAYGTGALPIISGADIATSWTSETIGAENFLDASGPQAVTYWAMESSGGGTIADTQGNNNINAYGTYSTVAGLSNTVGSNALSISAGANGANIPHANVSSGFTCKTSITNFTVGGWVRFNSDPADFATFMGYGNASDRGFRFDVDNSNKIRGVVVGSSVVGVGVANSAISLNTPYHVVMKKTGLTVELYINGVKQSTAIPLGSEAGLCSTGDFLGFGGSAQEIVDGWFDFSSALTDAQITSIYTSGLAATGQYTAYYKVAADPIQVFSDNVRLTRKADKTVLTPGTWAYDSGRVYVRLAGDDAPSDHTMEWSNSSRSVGLYIVGKNYVTIQDIHATKTAASGLFASNASSLTISTSLFDYSAIRGIHFYNASTDSTNAIIENNEVSYNLGNGIQLSEHTPGAIIRSNNVHHNATLNDTGEYIYTAGIKVTSDSAHGVLIEKNYVHSNGFNGATERGAGIWLDVQVNNSTVQYNRVKDNTYNGIRIEISSNALVQYNIISGTMGNEGGLVLAGRTGTDFANNNKYYNNVSYDNETAGILVYGDGNPNALTNNSFQNNIAVSNSVRNLWAFYGGENDGVNGSGNIYTYNAFGPESSNFIEWGYNNDLATYADFDAAYGSSTNSIQGNPQFTNAAGEDFTLQSNSPAIDTGTNLGTTYQLALNPSSTWPQDVTTLNQNTHGTGWDIGAYVYENDNTPVITPTEPTSSSSSRRTSARSRVNNLLQQGNTVAAQDIINQYPAAFPTGASTTIPPTPSTSVPLMLTRNLTLKNTGNDVQALQLFLIKTNTGPAATALQKNGATHYFGPLTKAALAEYQKAHGIVPAVGFFGPVTRNYIMAQ